MKILIADDQLLFAENLKIVIEALTDDLKVIGIASDGFQAVEMAKELNPDMILMDMRMPKLDGVEATKEIIQQKPQQKIIIITSFQEEKYAPKALHYGAIGYLLKDLPPQNLINAIRSANEGIVMLSNTTASQLFGRSEAVDEDEETLLWYKSVYINLNSREKEILQLMIKGYSNKKIADELYLSEATVRNYISSIYACFNNSNRFEVIQHGRKILAYFSDDSGEK